MTERKFYKAVLSFEVLSEHPLTEEGMGMDDIMDIAFNCIDGDCSGRILEFTEAVIDGKEAADALIVQGSDPEFFMIDTNGEDIE